MQERKKVTNGFKVSNHDFKGGGFVELLISMLGEIRSLEFRDERLKLMWTARGLFLHYIPPKMTPKRANTPSGHGLFNGHH